jgi:HAD superfamily hydrolase (TIGR01549 family)|tara:strand:- start:129 stop:752 length:624 start_codon:yes stop_codon:yes gene_type:complete
MKKKVIAFDLDGVIIDSLPNMKISWNETCKKNDLNISFLKYKKLIGVPFIQILKKLNVRNKLKKIQQDYEYFSIKYTHLIRCYPDISKVLNKLRKKYKIAIITSKSRKRSIYILKKKRLKYDMLVTPNDVRKGKPNPESVIKVLKKFSLKRENILLIGDTIFDYKLARNSKIDFFFAKWGYGALKQKSLNKLNKPIEILKKIDSKLF